MRLAGFYSKHLTNELSLYNKAIHLKFIPILNFVLISIHLIQVCISQAMNATNYVLTVSELVAYILGTFIYSVLRIIKIISKKTLFATVQSWILKAPERVNSVKNAFKNPQRMFQWCNIINNIKQKSKKYFWISVSRENLCELGHTNQINTDPLIIPQDLYLVLNMSAIKTQHTTHISHIIIILN